MKSMKRTVICVAALMLCLLTACSEEPAPAPATPPEDPTATTMFDDAITTYLSLLWQADHTAIEKAAPDTMYAHLQSQGYADKTTLTDFVREKAVAIQMSHYGARISSFTFDLAEYEALSAENTQTVLQELRLNYGIDTAAAGTAYSVFIDTMGVDENGNRIPIDGMPLSIVDIDGTLYVVEAIELINDYAYQQWLN